MKKKVIILALTLPLWFGASGAINDMRDNFDRGSELFKAGKFAEAANLFDRAKSEVNADPKCSPYAEKIDYYRAVCGARLREVGAQTRLETIITEYPNSIYRSEMLLESGSVYYHYEDYGKALERYSKVNSRDLTPLQKDEFYYKAGYSYFVTKDYKSSREYLAKVEKKSDFYTYALYCLAYSDYINGDYSAAKSGFSELKDNELFGAKVPYYLLQLGFLEDDFKYVTANGDAVLKKSAPEEAMQTARITGISNYRLKNYRKAIEYFKLYEKLGGIFDRDESYTYGFCQYMSGLYSDAIVTLSKVCTASDDLTQNASYHLADSYLHIGNKEMASSAFSIAAAAGSNRDIVEESLLSSGKLQYELGGGVFNEAINLLERYIKEFPKSKHIPQAREYLASAYYNSNNYVAAYDAITQLENPDNNIRSAVQKITYFRAMEYYNAGDLASAYKLLEQSYEYNYNPKYRALSKYWMGDITYRNGDYFKAIPMFKEYQNLSPETERENIFADYNSGYCYFSLKRWHEAKPWFDRFVQRYATADGYKADGYNRLGDIAYATRNFGEAITNYDKAITIESPQKYYAQLQRALMFGYTNKPTQKVESLKGIISADKGDYVDAAIYELGRTHMSQNNFREASTQYENLISTYPKSIYYTQSMLDLGLAALNMNNSAKAMECYKKVIGLSPGSPQAKEALSSVRTIYIDRNDVEGYFTFAKNVGMESDLTLIQKDSIAFSSAEKVYLSGNRERTVAAMKIYLAGYSKGNFRPNALYYLGESEQELGNRRDAMEAFEQLTTKYNSDYTVRGLDRLSKLYSEDKNYAQAAASYKRLADLSPTLAGYNDALRGYLSNIVAQDDDLKTLSAASLVLEAKNIDKNILLEATYAKAKSCEKLGDRDQALKLYSSISGEVSTPEGAEARYKVIEALFNQADYAAAEKSIMAMAKENNPQNYWLAKAFLTLGDIYIKKKDAFQARATLQSIIDGYTPADDGIVARAKEKMKLL